MNEHEFDDLFRKKIKESEGSSTEDFPGFEDVWKDVEVGLKPKLQRSSIMYTIGIAASICLLIVAGALFYTNRLPHEEISYHQEVVVLEKTSKGDGSMDGEALKLIEQKCLIEQAICETREFVQLKQQLVELENKSEEIENELKLFGPSPSIIKAQIKVENVRTDIIKELLKLQGNG